ISRLRLSSLSSVANVQRPEPPAAGLCVRAAIMPRERGPPQAPGRSSGAKGRSRALRHAGRRSRAAYNPPPRSRHLPCRPLPCSPGGTPLSLTILGLSGALTHDPSAALYIDGRLVAAAEEER